MYFPKKSKADFPLKAKASKREPAFKAYLTESWIPWYFSKNGGLVYSYCIHI